MHWGSCFNLINNVVLVLIKLQDKFDADVRQCFIELLRHGRRFRFINITNRMKYSPYIIIQIDYEKCILTYLMACWSVNLKILKAIKFRLSSWIKIDVFFHSYFKLELQYIKHWFWGLNLPVYCSAVEDKEYIRHTNIG